MDTVGWEQNRYDEVVRKLGLFMKQAGYKEADTSFIPVSGLSGENLAKPISEPKLSEWYKGSTLVEQIGKSWVILAIFTFSKQSFNESLNFCNRS